jgi:Fe-S oxidoreductase
MRRVQGYNLDEFIYTDKWNLAKIICGSEGTLATILEAKINLEPLPKFKSICVVHFKEVLKAIQAVETMLSFRPSAVEILDDSVIALSRENLMTRRSCHFIEGNPAAIQIVEFYGDTEADVLERPKQMIAKLKELGFGYAYPVFPEGKSYDDVWVIRKKGLGLMLGIKGDKTPLPFIEDSGIPINVLPEYIDRVLKVCAKHETKAAMYAHASVGVIHVRPILDLRDATDIERFKRISEDTFDLVKEYGGSWSGEHGDGLVRSYKLKEFFGDHVYGLLKEVKQLFDPANLMNPGKIIDAQPIDQNLRYGATYQDQPFETVFKYKNDGSFANAVHTCTGVGECRKVQGGTMCPSFKATREEEHSTRGRANALRLAMSGQLQDGLINEEVMDALDLCLSCKACKSECPSNVDMAKLKGEVLQKKYDEKGIPLRDRFVRDAAGMAAKFSGGLAPIINGIQKTKVFRSSLEKLVGIEKDRILPSYAKQPFYKWFAKNYKSQKAHHKKVVLFADTYLNFHEPNVGIAATKLLQTLGYEVLLANVGCCQRPKISHGFLKDAKKEGTQTAMNLKPFFEQGLDVVVCEPSCASALTDDLPDLIDDEQLALQLKEKVKMIDVFLLEEMEAGRIDTQLKVEAEQIFIHGHCHQKAIYGTKAMHQLIDNATISEIPSGCCGMAGSFGYEKEHYALSEKIGNEILIPFVNQMKDKDTLVACGFSCRHQIEHFTKKKAIHWVELFK